MNIRSISQMVIYGSFLCCSFALAQTKQSFISTDIFQANYFIENKGQFDTFSRFDRPVKFALESFNGIMYFNCNGFVYHLIKVEKKKEFAFFFKGEAEEEDEEEEEKKRKITEGDISMSWVGANPLAVMTSEVKSNHYFTYGTAEYNSFGYKKIKVKNLYPNIDVEYTLPEKGGVKYTLILHPGASIADLRIKYTGDKLRMKLNADGNLLIKNKVIDLLESGIDAYDETGAKVKCRFVLKDNMAGFALEENEQGITVKNNHTITIDPYIAPITSLTSFGQSQSNRGFDVDYDNSGNLFVYGGYLDTKKIAKYNPYGALIWTFGGYIPSISWNTSFAYFNISNFAVQKTTGKIFVGQGYEPSGGRIVRLNTAGVYDNYVTPGTSQYEEMWDINIDCRNKTIIGGGGGTTSNLDLLIMDSLGAVTLHNFTGDPAVLQDIVNSSIDYDGNLFLTIADAFKHNLGNHIYKINTTTYNGYVWDKVSGFTSFKESSNKPDLALTSVSNGFNALYANKHNLYYYDGINMKAFNKVNGDSIGSSYAIPGHDLKFQGGIYADECDNVYVGGNSGNLKIFKFNGNVFIPLSDIVLPGLTGRHVYDFKYHRGNNTFFISGDKFVATFTPVKLCDDTVIVTDLKIKCGDTAIVTIYRPDTAAPYSYIWRDHNENVIKAKYDVKYIYADTFVSTVPAAYSITTYKNAICDELIKTEYFVLNDTIVQHQDINICTGKTYWINNHGYSTTGIYSDTLYSGKGCPLILKTHLNVALPYNINLDTATCYPARLKVGTHEYTLPGSYIDTVVTLSGCDSIIHTTFTWKYATFRQLNETICDQQSLKIGTHVYTQSGSYKDTLINSVGCDSLVFTNLTVLPAKSVSLKISLCKGNTIMVGTQTLSQPGLYTLTIKTAQGCDSMIFLELIVYTSVYDSLDILICEGKSFAIGNHIYTQPGIYKDSLKTVDGCDSIIVLKLNVIAAHVSIEALPDTILFVGEKLTLLAHTLNVNDSIISWNPTLLLNRNDTSPVFSFPEKDTWYYITLITKEGCISIDSIFIKVMDRDSLIIPNVFTPDNNDGKNDAFDISISNVLTYKLEVYNRWGDLIFTGNKDGTANDGINWNGHVNNAGEECSEGTYYFIFNYRTYSMKAEKAVHGTVTLIRE